MTARTTIIAAVTLLALSGLAACSSGSDDPDSSPTDPQSSADESASPVMAYPPAQLSDNLCDLLPEDLAQFWDVRPTSHETRPDSARSIAECQAEALHKGEPVTFTTRLESRSGQTRAEARQVMRTLLQAECDSLGAGIPPGADLEEGRNYCALFHPGVRVLYVFLAKGVTGVGAVEAAYTGPDVEGVSVKVVGLAEPLERARPVSGRSG